jgi:hypothetical protein
MAGGDKGRPDKCAGNQRIKNIFLCVGNVVGNIAYYRHILLILQR